jgi:hypothetical protein
MYNICHISVITLCAKLKRVSYTNAQHTNVVRPVHSAQRDHDTDPTQDL